jgi:hypothetical protein
MNMVALSNNLSLCSHGHMVGPKEFFMSSKKKGLKSIQGATMSPMEKSFKFP